MCASVFEAFSLHFILQLSTPNVFLINFLIVENGREMKFISSQAEEELVVEAKKVLLQFFFGSKERKSFAAFF